jgi:hypothetical protein
MATAPICTDHPPTSDKTTQQSASLSLIRKLKDWRYWTYTDGSLQKYKEGQDIGSGVYHPHLNISHYVNPRGAGITNTISRAELAAIAAAIIHGYSHIATDSLTSIHQIKTQLTSKSPPLSHPKEMSSNSLPRQFASHHPFTSTKPSLTPASSAMNTPMPLPESQSPPTLTLLIPSSK